MSICLCLENDMSVICGFSIICKHTQVKLYRKYGATLCQINLIFR